MRVLRDHAHGDRPAPALMVLLPGALQQPEAFLQAGFAEAVRAQGVPLDLALVDTGMRYISDSIDGTILHQLHEDVMAPAQAAGYREIWIAGASIGGLMAIAYADRHPTALSGLCLLAPYPGSRITMAAIDAAGGLENWRHATQDDDAENRMWQWLARHDDAGRPQVQIGYGRDDRFADGQARMAQALGCAAEVVDGGHDLAAWRALWDRFIARSAPHFMQLAAGDSN